MSEVKRAQSFYKFTRVSGNSKTGPIPTTMSSGDTCPDNCGLKKNGCYAEYGMVGLHWRKTDKGEHAGTWSELCSNVQALPRGQLWRHNVAGDLPSYQADATLINISMLEQLVRANKGKRGFTYTHHKMWSHNSGLIQWANEEGFTVNLSADTLEQADTLVSLGVAPVVCVLPENAPKVSYTPAGHTVVVCPAVYRDDVTCSSCGVCAVPTRKAIIGFPVHGSGKKKAQKVFMFKKV